MVDPEGLEPSTPRLEIWCSIQLSYGSSEGNLRFIRNRRENQEKAIFAMAAICWGRTTSTRENCPVQADFVDSPST